MSLTYLRNIKVNIFNKHLDRGLKLAMLWFKDTDLRIIGKK